MQKENITLKKLSPYVAHIYISKESTVIYLTSILIGKASGNNVPKTVEFL
jgi:hypothetical protein